MCWCVLEILFCSGNNDGSNCQWWFYPLELEEILEETKGVKIDFNSFLMVPLITKHYSLFFVVA